MNTDPKKTEDPPIAPDNDDYWELVTETNDDDDGVVWENDDDEFSDADDFEDADEEDI